MYKEKYVEFQPTGPIVIEKDIEKALEVNLFRLLRQIAGLDEQFGSHNLFEIKGDLDFIFFSANSTTKKLLLAIEAKTKQVLSSNEFFISVNGVDVRTDDLVTKFKNNVENDVKVRCESNKGNPAARHIWVRQLWLRGAWLHGL